MSGEGFGLYAEARPPDIGLIPAGLRPASPLGRAIDPAPLHSYHSPGFLQRPGCSDARPGAAPAVRAAFANLRARVERCSPSPPI